MMAGLLYLGAEIGMLLMEKMTQNMQEQPLTKKELPLSLIIFKEQPSVIFIIALVIMAIGTYFASTSEI